jgi:hypothetical protein
MGDIESELHKIIIQRLKFFFHKFTRKKLHAAMKRYNSSQLL